MKLWHLAAAAALWYWLTQRPGKAPPPARAVVAQKPTPEGIYYRVDQANPLGLSTAGMDQEQRAAVSRGDSDYMLSGLSDGDQ